MGVEGAGMNQKLNRFNQIEHDTSRCDCDMCQFARNSAQKRVNPPSEPPTTGKGDAGFLVPEAENVSQGDSGRAVTHLITRSKLRAVLFNVIDSGWQCGHALRY